MAIPNETIIKRMMDELTKAQSNQNNQHQMVKHIENVRLLSELLIEADNAGPESASPKDISDKEMKAMLGNIKSKESSGERESGIGHDNANGKSIFDF